ncbi:MAG: murein biosynthesis integral membrane protein MurJ [Acidobacteriota bacterium]
MSTAGKNIAKAAGFMMVTTIIARLLGLVRDQIFTAWFGRNHLTDAYSAAFSIPDLVYMLLVGGALSSAFIPVFSKYLALDQEEEAWKVASIMLNVTVVFLLVIIIVAEIYTRPLVKALVPGLPPDMINVGVTLTRIMFIQTFIMALNGLALGILNSKQHFTSPAIGSIVYNVGIIGMGLALSHKIGIMGFAIGVVTGALLNLAVQIPALLRTRPKYHFSFDVRHPGFKQMMILMLPVLVGLSVTQLNLFVTQNKASDLAAGSISALRLAQRIMQMPIGVFGISIAMAIFPSMNAQVARMDLAEFKRTVSLGLRAMFLITIPSAAGLIALKGPIIQLLFQFGKFHATDAAATAVALMFYSFGLFAYSALQLLNRVFYSLKDTVTPVVTGVISIALNIGLSIVLVQYLQHRGLALAYSLAGIINMLMLLVIFKWRMKTIDGARIARGFIISLLAAGIMFVPTYLIGEFLLANLHLTPKLDQLITVLVGIAVGTMIYGFVILKFKLEEAQMILDMMKKRFPRLSFLG